MKEIYLKPKWESITPNSKVNREGEQELVLKGKYLPFYFKDDTNYKVVQGLNKEKPNVTKIDLKEGTITIQTVKETQTVNEQKFTFYFNGMSSITPSFSYLSKVEEIKVISLSSYQFAPFKQ